MFGKNSGLIQTFSAMAERLPTHSPGFARNLIAIKFFADVE